MDEEKKQQEPEDWTQEQREYWNNFRKKVLETSGLRLLGEAIEKKSPKKKKEKGNHFTRKSESLRERDDPRDAENLERKSRRRRRRKSHTKELPKFVYYDAQMMKMIMEDKSYKNKRILKKDGKSYRNLSIPNASLKKVQRLLLKEWLYKMLLRKKEIDCVANFFEGEDTVRNFIPGEIKGFLPEIPLIENARPHLNKYHQKRWVLNMDLEKAFDNVSAGDVRKALFKLVHEEVRIIQWTEMMSKRCWENGEKIHFKKIYPTPSLFPSTRSAWFRKDIRERDENDALDEAVDEIINHFVTAFVELTTHKDALPQGAPTSPFLLNLVIAYYELAQDIKSFVQERTKSRYCDITIYADDISISGDGKMSKSISEEIEHFISNDKGFLVNKRKTKIYFIDSQAPEITGLKIVPYPLKKEQAGWRFERDHKGATKKFKENKMWNDYRIALPKYKVKQIRACIHNATTQEFTKKTHNKILGYLAYARGIYGEKLPNQLWNPWLKYKEKHKV